MLQSSSYDIYKKSLIFLSIFCVIEEQRVNLVQGLFACLIVELLAVCVMMLVCGCFIGFHYLLLLFHHDCSLCLFGLNSLSLSSLVGWLVCEFHKLNQFTLAFSLSVCMFFLQDSHISRRKNVNTLFVNAKDDDETSSRIKNLFCQI